MIRRTAVDFGVSLITDVKIAQRMVSALKYLNENEIELKAWEEY